MFCVQQFPRLIIVQIIILKLLTNCILATDATNEISQNSREREEPEEIVSNEGNITSLPSPEEKNNSASFGFMFDLKTNNKMIIITGFEFFTREVEEVNYELYTVQGDYALSKHNIKLWTLIASGSTNGQGLEQPTKIEKLESLSISTNSTHGFLLSLQTQNLVYSSTELGLGEISTSNDDISISLGSGVSTYPLSDALFEPRSWCGIINYYVMEYDTVSPTVSPTSQPILTTENPSTSPSHVPTKVPSINPTYYPTEIIQHLNTNQTITLFGSDLTFMSQDATEALCNEIKLSLQQYFTKMHGKDLRITELYARNQLLLGSYNEIGIHINAKYESPLDIDLSNIVKSSITNLRQTILLNLQRDIDYFQNIKRLVCVITPDLESEYQIVNLNQSISLIYPKDHDVIYMDTPSTITYENEVTTFFDNELSNNINPNSYIVMTYVTSQSINNKESSLDTWVTIRAKYLPSSDSDDFNLVRVIQSIMMEDSKRLYYRLKDTDENVFKNLESTTATTQNSPQNNTSLPTSPPTTTTNEEGEEENNINITISTTSIKSFLFSTMGYVVMGVTAFVVIILIAIFIFCGCCRKFCCCCCFDNNKEKYNNGPRHEGMVVEVPGDDRTSAMSTLPSYACNDNHNRNSMSGRNSSRSMGGNLNHANNNRRTPNRANSSKRHRV